MLKIALVYLVLINIITFIIYVDDKRRARRSRWRTSEATLVTLAIIGGSLGALLAMILFHHKTRHTSFVIGIPTIFITQLIFAYLMLG